MEGYLRKLGLPRFEVDTVNYNPTGGEPRKRPDRAAAMTAANQAAKNRKTK